MKIFRLVISLIMGIPLGFAGLNFWEEKQLGLLWMLIFIWLAWGSIMSLLGHIIDTKGT